MGYLFFGSFVKGVWRYLLLDGLDRIESHAFLVPTKMNEMPVLVGLVGTWKLSVEIEIVADDVSKCLINTTMDKDLEFLSK